MLNIPDDCVNHPNAPWNEEEWYCPICGGHMDDVNCEPQNAFCDKYDVLGLCDCGNDCVNDCECEGEEDEI